MESLNTQDILARAEAVPHYPGWEYAMSETSHLRSSWVARHRATGLTLRGVEDYSNLGDGERVVSLRTPCCGVGYMKDRQEVLCLTCKAVMPYRASQLNSIVGFKAVREQAYWWEPHLNPLDAVLQAVEASEVAYTMEAMWQFKLMERSS